MTKTGNPKDPANFRAQRGPIIGLVLGAAIPVAVIPAAAQQMDQEAEQAQSVVDYRNMTVLQRPRESFDPLGISVGQGGVKILPSLQLSESFTDNLRDTPTHQISDYETDLNPEVKIESNWSRHKLEMRGWAEIHRFIDTHTENHDDYGGESDLRLDLANEGTLTLSGGYNHVMVSRADPEEAGRQTPEELSNTTGKVEWAQQFSRLILGARAEYLDVEEDSPLDADNNRKEYTGAVRIGYAFSPSLNIFAEPFYTLRDFDLGVDSTGVNRDANISGINAGFGYDITHLIYGQTKIGWYRADFKDSRFKSNSGLQIESTTTWNFSPRDSLILKIERTNVFSVQPNASSRVLTGAQLEIQHDLTRNIVLRGDVSYYNNDYVESPLQDNQLQFLARGDYFLTRNCSFYVSYQYLNDDTNFPGGDYDENRVTFGIRGQI